MAVSKLVKMAKKFNVAVKKTKVKALKDAIIDIDQDDDEVKEEFFDGMESVRDEGKIDAIPDSVVDFYNDLIAKESGNEEEEEEEEEDPDEEEEEEEEEDPDEEEEEEEEEEEDEFDDMDRNALVKAAKAAGIKCLKSMSEDDYREALRSKKEKPSGKKPSGKKPSGKKTSGKKPDRFSRPEGALSVSEACAMGFKKYKGKAIDQGKFVTFCNDARVKSGGADNRNTINGYVKVITESMIACGAATMKGKKIVIMKK